MRRTATIIVIALGLAALTAVLAQDGPENLAAHAWKLSRGPYQVTTIDEAFLYDADRDKTLPLKIYYPAEQAEYPIIIFSHGAGGSKDGKAGLGEFWASHGYVCIHPTHADSISLTGLSLRETVVQALTDVQSWRDRPADISLIINGFAELQRLNEDLQGRMDFEKVGVAGHSFGAFTTQAIGGAVLDLPGSDEPVSLADERVTATLLLSPQGPGQMGLTEDSWANYTLPMMSMTGPADKGAKGQDATWRVAAFDSSVEGDKYFVWIEGANHFSFSGGALAALIGGTSAVQQPVILAWVKQASLAYWDAYLKGDEEAMAYLQSDALVTLSSGAIDLRRR